MYLSFTVFFSTSVLKKLIFSGLLMKKWDQKVGHIDKFISCTGLDNTGRSLFFYCTGWHYPGSLNCRFKDSFKSSYEPYLVNWIPTALKWVALTGKQKKKGFDNCFCYRPNISCTLFCRIGLECHICMKIVMICTWVAVWRGFNVVVRNTRVWEPGRSQHTCKGFEPDVIAVFEPRHLLKVELESLCIKLEGLQV